MHMVHINPCRHIHVNKKTILNLKKKRNYVCVCGGGGRDTSIFSGFIYCIQILSARNNACSALFDSLKKMTKMSDVSNVQEHTVF